MCVTQEEMHQIFSRVGKKHGYDSVTAEFSAFKDFKAFWERGYKFIDFQISDYLMDAPAEAVESLAERIYSSIEGKEQPYSDAMKEWALSDEFITKERPIYLKRSRNLRKDGKGDFRDLNSCLLRLKDKELIDLDENVFLSWTREELNSRTGYCSALMKTIAISSYFDKAEVPNHVLDYIVYYHYLIMKEARSTFGGRMTKTYIEELKKYPFYQDAERYISEAGLYL